MHGKNNSKKNLTYGRIVRLVPTDSLYTTCSYYIKVLVMEIFLQFHVLEWINAIIEVSIIQKIK